MYKNAYDYIKIIRLNGPHPLTEEILLQPKYSRLEHLKILNYSAIVSLKHLSRSLKRLDVGEDLQSSVNHL